MSEKTHWKKYSNPNYLGSYAFQPGEEKVVTIKEVKREVVVNPADNSKDECTVAHFQEDIKPLILNATNCKAITKALGTAYIEDWAGHRIILKVKRISAFGEMVDAVRVATERPVDVSVKCQKCGKDITAVPGKTVQQIVAATTNRFNKALCMECAQKEAK